MHLYKNSAPVYSIEGRHATKTNATASIRHIVIRAGRPPHLLDLSLHVMVFFQKCDQFYPFLIAMQCRKISQNETRQGTLERVSMNLLTISYPFLQII